MAPDCEFLSVKFDDPLDETLSLVQPTSSLSSFTSALTTSSNFSSLMTTSSFTFRGGEVNSSDCNFASEDLASVFWLVRSLDNGNPRLTVSMSWYASILLALLPRPPLLLGLAFGVCVQASQLVVLSSTSTPGSRTKLTPLVEPQDEHHSTSVGQSDDFSYSGSSSTRSLRRWISSRQGCIFRLTCSHPELTKDHVLTSAYVKIL